MILAEANPLAFNLLPFFTSIVVSLIFVGILYAKVWPTITKGLDERNQKIIGEIKAAEEARKEAKAAQESFQRKLAEAQAESMQMIRHAQAEAQRQGEEQRARVEAELADRQRRASEEIESARRAAVAQLESQAADLAVAIAGRILSREVNAADQRKLVDESLKQFATSRN